MNDIFWFKDAKILFNKDKLTHFVPTKTMTYNETLNAYTRLSIYLGVLLYMYSGKYHYLYIIIIGLISTYLIYKKKENINEMFIEESKYPVNYVLPTKNNPFMNPLMTDYIDNPTRKAYSAKFRPPNKEIDKRIKDTFNINLYKDLSDVFEKENSQRQYYTVPSTTIPNNQRTFANWLYNTPPTCKEGNGAQCVANVYTPLYVNNQDPI